jgi:hypothetical protein
MNFRKVNNITGWVVGVIACTVYFITREPTGSFWDCGEFVSCAYKMEIPHPPGSPLFSMLGRLFIVLFSGGNPANAASSVNLLSAMASGFTILFLFWTITYFARKMFVNAGEDLTSQQLFTVMAAGTVGALAYTFSDSFWFSAVEGEVYALASFFTAILFWAILKWYHADELAQTAAEKKRADRWIVFIFFMLGLSITVHLLNLLTIPAIVMLYYYRRYVYKRTAAIFAFLLSFAITGLILWVFIYLIPRWSANFDRIFVNSFNLPFFSGFAFFFVLLGVLCWYGLRWAGKRRRSMLTLCIWCFIFLLVGYSTYVTTLIRSNANPSIDMSNVDNPMSLASYFGREQYGSAPLIYGPHYQAQPKEDPDRQGYAAFKEGRMKYIKGKNKYIPVGKDRTYDYRDEDMQLFPRVWDGSNDQGHAQFYADWLSLAQRDQQGNIVGYDPPTYSDNMQWFFTYQLGVMYWRYFMWNFAGKQNDLQGLGNVRDGNWISGISFIDNQMLGDQSRMPASSTKNKAHNKLFLLPFLLGILGCVYQFMKHKKDWVINFLLFFMTGIAIGLYLNMPGPQPRERDYAFVGSFYAFAIWIGLAVPALFRLVREQDKKFFTNVLIYGSVLSFFIGLMSESWHTKQAFPASLMIAVLFAAFAAIVVYGIRAISSSGQNIKLINISVAVVCLIAPIIMAQQEWDDHDRSKKHMASDVARDYLESCAKDAILFTFGDNDTYPLWYAQEVEGVRPDIRIINNSLLGIDWYINQLRYKVNQSDPIDVIWTAEQIEGENRNYMFYQANSDKPDETFYPLYQTMKNEWGKPLIDEETGRDLGAQTFSQRRFIVPVDTALVRRNGTVNPNDTVFTEMRFELPIQQGRRFFIQKNDLTILNVIAANNWKRPIYFTSPYGNLGFGQYLRKDGLTYRLVPIKIQRPDDKWVINQRINMSGDMNIDFATKKLFEKFVYTSKTGAYFDEENRRHGLSIRTTFAEAAGDNADIGKKDTALKLLNKSESMINSDDLPYASISSRQSSHNLYGLFYLEACYKAGNLQLAEKVKQALRKDMQQQRSYYNYLRDEREDLYTTLENEARTNEYMLTFLDDIEKAYTGKTETGIPPVEGKNPTIINNPTDSPQRPVGNKAKDTNKK